MITELVRFSASQNNTTELKNSALDIHLGSDSFLIDSLMRIFSFSWPQIYFEKLGKCGNGYLSISDITTCVQTI